MLACVAWGGGYDVGSITDVSLNFILIDLDTLHLLRHHTGTSVHSLLQEKPRWKDAKYDQSFKIQRSHHNN